MKLFLTTICIVLLAACTAKPGSEGWCETKKAQSKSEWTGDDAKTFAKHCVFDSQTIGSEKWCENLDEKPKGEWSGNEAGDYAKHCVL